jgi:hypothetical protein
MIFVIELKCWNFVMYCLSFKNDIVHFLLEITNVSKLAQVPIAKIYVTSCILWCECGCEHY